jgi:hypothetical protein
MLKRKDICRSVTVILSSFCPLVTIAGKNAMLLGFMQAEVLIMIVRISLDSWIQIICCVAGNNLPRNE